MVLYGMVWYGMCLYDLYMILKFFNLNPQVLCLENCYLFFLDEKRSFGKLSSILNSKYIQKTHTHTHTHAHTRTHTHAHTHTHTHACKERMELYAMVWFGSVWFSMV
jgi:hypothetical protein